MLYSCDMPLHEILLVGVSRLITQLLLPILEACCHRLKVPDSSAQLIIFYKANEVMARSGPMASPAEAPVSARPHHACSTVKKLANSSNCVIMHDEHDEQSIIIGTYQL